ncbi:MAG: hypothetical protein HQM10_14710 [Candidatus Riflebacteria bacterium]|nr:hypothetical protein [Candidatus Riflebacteria bacterium]
MGVKKHLRELLRPLQFTDSMKIKTSGFVFILFIFFSFSCFEYTHASEKVSSDSQVIGIFDYSTALSLHPRMSLFDFSRSGFYKVRLFLDLKSWSDEILKLKQDAEKSESELKKRIEEIESKISECESKRIEGLTGKNSEVNITSIADQIEKYKLEQKEIDYQLKNPELTSPSETRLILNQIESEISSELKKYAEESGIGLILNNSMPSETETFSDHNSQFNQETGLSGIQNELYYSFLANDSNKRVKLSAMTAASKWLKQSSSPSTKAFYFKKVHPLVLHGGKEITVEIIERILLRYNCGKDILEKIRVVLSEHSNNR